MFERQSQSPANVTSCQRTKSHHVACGCCRENKLKVVLCFALVFIADPDDFFFFSGWKNERLFPGNAAVNFKSIYTGIRE